MKVIENFIKKNFKKIKNNEELELVTNYLEKNFLNKKSINFSYIQAVEKAKKWKEEEDNKEKNKINPGLTETVFTFGDGFKIVKLLDNSSKDWDGFFMNNCLNQKDSEFRSDTYVKNSSYELFSFRDENEKPYCNIEIKNNKITQIRGRSNSLVKKKYIKYILEFIFNKNLEISDFEIHNLGFFSFDEENNTLIKNHFSGFSYIEYRGRVFFSQREQWKMIKEIKAVSDNLYLLLCEYNNCIEAIDQLIKNGIFYSSNFDYGLALAAEKGHLDVVKLLLKNGAKPDSYVLKLASRFGHEEVVKLLLEHGCLFDQQAFDWAVRFSHKNVADILLKSKESLK